MQLIACSESPVQYTPPVVGTGLVHVRWRLIKPPPQGGQAELQMDHADQLPSTGSRTTHRDSVFCTCHIKQYHVHGMTTWIEGFRNFNCINQFSISLLRTISLKHLFNPKQPKSIKLILPLPRNRDHKAFNQPDLTEVTNHGLLTPLLTIIIDTLINESIYSDNGYIQGYKTDL